MMSNISMGKFAALNYILINITLIVILFIVFYLLRLRFLNYFSL